MNFVPVLLLLVFKSLLMNCLLQAWKVSGLESWSSIGGTRSSSSGDSSSSSSLRGPSSLLSSSTSSSSAEIRSDSPNESSQKEGGHVQVGNTDLSSDMDLAEEGITFSRSIQIQTDTLNVHFEFDTDHCSTIDEYGNNQCHYSWGETVILGINVTTTQPFNENDRVYASMKVDYFVPWVLDCAVCGEDCVMKIPVVDFEVTIPMLPCPLEVEDIPTLLEVPLGDASPFEGVPFHAAGDIYLKRNSTNTDGSSSSDVLAQSHVVVNVH